MAVAQKPVAALQYDPAADAALDIRKAIEAARKSGKRILLDIGGDWCPWCHAFDRVFQESPELVSLREQNFITVPIYYSSDHKNEQALSAYSRITGIPHIFVLSADGLLIQSQAVVDLQTDGAYSKQKIREFLIQWAPKRGKEAEPGSEAVSER